MDFLIVDKVIADLPAHDDDTSPDLPSMMNSVFDYVMVGSCRPTPPDPLTDCTAFSNAVCMVSLEESLERFWKLEEVNVANSYSPDEQRLQDDLLDVILRFRSYPVALVGDIAKMYRQVLLHPEDRRFVRILFRFSPQTPVHTNELNTVTYGLTPSSFLATRTLLQLAEDEGSDYSPACSALKRNFYVDDFIGGALLLRKEDALLPRKELAGVLAKGGFELRKWTSNRLDVLSGFRADQIGTQSLYQFVPNETVKALGISWKPESDELCFEPNVCDEPTTLTRRSILSCIGKMYDPLGLIAPIIIRAKMLMQELWLLRSGWDDPVPDVICNKWKAIQPDWNSLRECKIYRYVLLPYSKVELHTFTDASETA
ncbi:uncharacterized protein LOC118515186 [Anopheles stephensi]|uniref:uncharacterized protein LOC118515186 n=1 Tax=Anopheles stephensi TaxID=30069 RepID=UPI001658AFBD|nr:uncharacterized protein LOC118515186 [Anopheles stephensi]